MKKWYKSKTIWFNVFNLSLTAATAALMHIDKIGLDPVTAAQIALGLAMFTQVGNKVLRSITTGGIER